MGRGKGAKVKVKVKGKKGKGQGKGWTLDRGGGVVYVTYIACLCAKTQLGKDLQTAATESSLRYLTSHEYIRTDMLD